MDKFWSIYDCPVKYDSYKEKCADELVALEFHKKLDCGLYPAMEAIKYLREHPELRKKGITEEGYILSMISEEKTPDLGISHGRMLYFSDTPKGKKFKDKYLKDHAKPKKEKHDYIPGQMMFELGGYVIKGA